MPVLHRTVVSTLASLMALLALIGTTVMLGLSAGIAEAATSRTHNNYYSYAGLYQAPSTTGSTVIANEYNDQQVTMLCYTDAQNVTSRSYSNYDSARWFRIRDAGGRVGYIHSSYVFNQTAVGRC